MDEAGLNANEATWTDERRLVEFLHERDVKCPGCGYNLRNLLRPVCPECRQDLLLSVGLREVRLRWFMAAAAPSIFSGIAAVLLSIICVVAYSLYGGSPPDEVLLILGFGYFSGLVGGALLVRRGGFIAMSADKQIGITAITWIVHVIAFVFLLRYIF